jgi:hypothetical protein
MDTPNLQQRLEQELADARKREDEVRREWEEVKQERERIERTLNVYMEKPTSRRRSIPGQVVVVRQPKTMRDHIIDAVERFDESEAFNARDIFELLDRDESKYHTTRPTITTTLRELEDKGQLKKTRHGMYQRKE